MVGVEWVSCTPSAIGSHHPFQGFFLPFAIFPLSLALLQASTSSYFSPLFPHGKRTQRHQTLARTLAVIDFSFTRLPQADVTFDCSQFSAANGFFAGRNPNFSCSPHSI
ncbi:hypothetical protein B0H12DRAFT_657409 [Mycena haematopus]|nr:hypothetical protein B0H12DRAFT_657409 [Mycena haematopus]